MNIATASTGRQHTMSALTMRIVSLFNKSAAATIEMAYQNTDPYQFDSTRFEITFAMTPTPYEKGIGDTLATIKSVRI